MFRSNAPLSLSSLLPKLALTRNGGLGVVLGVTCVLASTACTAGVQGVEDSDRAASASQATPAIAPSSRPASGALAPFDPPTSGGFSGHLRGILGGVEGTAVIEYSPSPLTQAPQRVGSFIGDDGAVMPLTWVDGNASNAELTIAGAVGLQSLLLTQDSAGWVYSAWGTGGGREIVATGRWCDATASAGCVPTETVVSTALPVVEICPAGTHVCRGACLPASERCD